MSISEHNGAAIVPPEEPRASRWWHQEDWWSIILALLLISTAVILFSQGGSIKWLATAPAKWTTLDEAGRDLVSRLPALVLGLVVSNIGQISDWLAQSLRVEYFIKIGIVLLGATLPLALILWAGPVAIGQAAIVSLVIFFVIYFAARLLGLEQRFAAVLGVGGAVCGDEDPDNFFATLFSCDATHNGSNYSKWCYKPFEDVIQAARVESDQQKRAVGECKINQPSANLAQSASRCNFPEAPLGNAATR